MSLNYFLLLYVKLYLAQNKKFNLKLDIDIKEGKCVFVSKIFLFEFFNR